MDAQARYEEIADDLAAQNDDVTLGQMMGMPAIKRGGKMIGGFSIKEWVVVPAAHADRWPDLAQQALLTAVS
jgi:hypothetical protein